MVSLDGLGDETRINNHPWFDKEIMERLGLEKNICGLIQLEDRKRATWRKKALSDSSLDAHCPAGSNLTSKDKYAIHMAEVWRDS